jgi:phosphatidylinositol alpha-1,6-mannosyltransferase
MNSSALDIVSLFPSFDTGGFGGIQASGREAWRSIVSRIGEQRAHALYYQAGDSKSKVVLRAIRSRRNAKVVLVWHIHLLKLLPFLDSSAARVILFLHGIEAWPKQDSITRLLLRKVHLVLSNSDHTWSRFVACNPAFQSTRHQTVPLGIGCRFGAVTPSPSQPPMVLMVGRLDKNENYKGHREVIAAWPMVMDRLPQAELWIVGDGNLRPDLERAAREHAVDKSVRFLGQVPDARKEELISQSRCLALPSRGEGFGLVYLEAMRMGRPCLVSNLDAGREVVNPPEAGLAVDPGNPREVSDALQRLLSSGYEWDQWSAQARKRYEEHFTSEQFQQRLLTALFES